MSVIECNDVSIKYVSGDIKQIGLKEYVMRKLTGRFTKTIFWADQDITFSLEKGDMLGIIGSNGAGKSTLLKAITGVMLPSKGKIHVKGDIAALLELASGFDGDMTVRENTYLRGAMLGYTKEFLNKKYDEIIAFAELQDFQDYMFKQLSSGMKSRLAFAIACLVDPDIIILDEVLSVGDGAFRKKSGEKMKEILSGGVTGILVSHSVGQIRELCNKVLWIDHGHQITFSDDVETVCNAYEEFLITKELPQEDGDFIKMSMAYSERLRAERAEKKAKEVSKLQKMLEEGNNDSAVEAALRILANNTPELLNKEEVARRKEKLG